MKTRSKIQFLKRNSFLSFILVLFVIGCDGDKTVQTTYFDPLKFQFMVRDQNGTDLLDTEWSGNILKNIVVSYEGKEYSLDANKENFISFDIERKDNSLSVLSIGSFFPEQDYKNQKITFSFWEGHAYEFSFDYYITWNKDMPILNSQILKDGKEFKENILDIVLQDFESTEIPITNVDLSEKINLENLKEDVLYIFRSEDELSKFWKNGEISEVIDFTKNSLLIVRGRTTNGIQEINNLLYENLDIDVLYYTINILLNDTMITPEWHCSALIPRISEVYRITFKTNIIK